jgi:tyrosyl-tRNA synthetase
VLKPDGTKFGKSESGTVWLDPARTTPYRLYQFFVNVEDEMVGTYLRYFSFRTAEEIEALETESAARRSGRLAQRELAADVVGFVHGGAEVARAQRASQALFGEAISELDEATLMDVTSDAPSSALDRGSLDAGTTDLVSVLVSAGLASSASEARRTIEQGGAYVNNRRETDIARRLGSADLLHGRYIVLRRGARTHHVLRLDPPAR